MKQGLLGPMAGPIVSGLNGAFLELFRRVYPDPMGLDPALAARLADLPPEACRRLAELPCVLFGFGLAGRGGWDGVLESSAPAACQRPELSQFLLVALSSLSTIAASDRDTAAVRFGIPEWVLDRLVEGGPPVAFRLASRLDVRARFGSCRGLWSALLGAATRRRPTGLDGLQVQWVSLSLARAIGVNPARDAGRRLYRASADRRRPTGRAGTFLPAGEGELTRR